VSLKSTADFVVKLISNKKFRDAYVHEHIKTGVPFQLRALRTARGWTQAELGERVGKKQHGISRLENPNLGDELSIRSLLEMASAFDVALLIKFVPFSRLLKEYEDVSPQGLAAASIAEETRRLKAWATARDRAEAVKSTAELVSAQPLRLVESPRQVGLFAGSTQAAVWMPVRPLKEARGLPPVRTPHRSTLKAVS
jgi:transcriptional regulator with XRE-family HTH domain